jgi:hypothetical protein
MPADPIDEGVPAERGAARPQTVFDQRGQQVETQINIAGDYVDRRQGGPPAGSDSPGEDGLR